MEIEKYICEGRSRLLLFFVAGLPLLLCFTLCRLSRIRMSGWYLITGI